MPHEVALPDSHCLLLTDQFGGQGTPHPLGLCLTIPVDSSGKQVMCSSWLGHGFGVLGEGGEETERERVWYWSEGG
jgi:hypothetical protein